jgi:hypothetical protein
MNKKKHPLYNKKYDELNRDQTNNILVSYFYPNSKWRQKIWTIDPDTNECKYPVRAAFFGALPGGYMWWDNDEFGYKRTKALFRKHKLLKEFE